VPCRAALRVNERDRISCELDRTINYTATTPAAAAANDDDDDDDADTISTY